MSIATKVEQAWNNPQQALWMLAKMAAGQKPSRINRANYEQALAEIDKTAQSPAHTEIETAAAEFHKKGLCRLDLGTEVIDGLAKELNFDLDVANRHIRYDWIGNTRAAFNPHMMTAEPSQQVLDRIYELLYAPRVAALFQRCCGGDVRFISCRPFQSLPHQEEGTGPQTYHRDYCPPGIIRGLIYLVDVDLDTGPFEYMSPDNRPIQATAPRGTLLIFDADRLLHRALPPRLHTRRVIDLVVAPRTRAQQRCVIWSGMNAWPSDPLHFTVRGMRASPPLASPVMVSTPPAA